MSNGKLFLLTVKLSAGESIYYAVGKTLQEAIINTKCLIFETIFEWPEVEEAK